MTYDVGCTKAKNNVYPLILKLDLFRARRIPRNLQFQDKGMLGRKEDE